MTCIDKVSKPGYLYADFYDSVILSDGPNSEHLYVAIPFIYPFLSAYTRVCKSTFKVSASKLKVLPPWISFCRYQYAEP
jgi:hypothetical protein